MIQSSLAALVRLTRRSASRQRLRTNDAKTMRTSRNLPKRSWQNLALIAVPAAVLVGIETYHATTILPELARSRAAAAHTLQVIDAARTLDEAIQDAQRGERGFIITGDLEHLEPYPAGVRAQAVQADGTMIHDFLIKRSRRSLHVCNAPSPAATAALPIGRHLVDRFCEEFSFPATTSS